VSSKAAQPELVPGGPHTTRILGIDPGSIVTGWGLVGGSAARPRWLAAGVIRLGAARTSLPQRLRRLQESLEALIREQQPTTVAVESSYHGANARSTLLLAQARGVVLAAVAGAGVELTEYSPASIKKAVVGHGAASKDQVRYMVAHLLGRAPGAGPHDLSDALAVALCHAGTSRRRGLLVKPGRVRAAARELPRG